MNEKPNAPAPYSFENDLSKTQTVLGWIWLGIENVQSFQLEYAQKYGLARFLDPVDFQGVYHILELDGDGNIVISSRNGM